VQPGILYSDSNVSEDAGLEPRTVAAVNAKVAADSRHSGI